MNKKLFISQIIQSTSAVLPSSGQLLYKHLAYRLGNNIKTEISFYGIKWITARFLQESVGQLYFEFNHNVIKETLSVRDMQPEDMLLLKKVIDNAKHRSIHGNKGMWDAKTEEE